METTGDRQATPERLMDAAMRLFAERGFRGTTVGQIESEAGLAPRSGALYQHFSGKEDLLEQAIERQLAAIDELGSALQMLPLGDLRAELTLMGRWNLDSLDRRRDLVRFLRREGEQLSQEVRSKLYERLVELPYEQVVGWLRSRLGDTGSNEPDLHALALIVIEPMASFRSIEWTFGEVPGDVDDERLIATWVEVCLAYARSLGLK